MNGCAMADRPSPLLIDAAQVNAVRLRTFVVLRWIAALGQIAAVVVAVVYFELDLDLGLCFMAVGTLIIANLVAMIAYPENKRLSEKEATAMLLFDIMQLAFLIYLTGGLHNPFALLMLAPVTIAASLLNLRATIIVGLIAVSLISLVAYFHVPLHTKQGTKVEMPPIFVFGFWISIIIGAAFLGFYAHRVTEEVRAMSHALLATQMALDRQQKLTDLGGVVAAAAHELGTPLTTIKLVSTELLEDLRDHPDLAADIQLIRDQTDRCRDILRSMGEVGKEDLLLRYAPLSALLEEAAKPHMNRGKTIHFEIHPDPNASRSEPEMRRAPEIIHGLRTLIQNAVDFARANVWIEARWTKDRITVRITDDGEGFPPHLLGRIGEPFLRHRKSAVERALRPGYEGMGLGLFIAKTLLERSGAELSFANCSDPFLRANERPEKCGSVVVVTWPYDEIAVDEHVYRQALGENRPVES